MYLIFCVARAASYGAISLRWRNIMAVTVLTANLLAWQHRHHGAASAA